jgi:hypothetical protein
VLGEPVEELLNICKDNKVYVPSPHTVPRILDKLISHFIEPECTQPTFLWGHPIIMSPLAKDIKLESVRVLKETGHRGNGRDNAFVLILYYSLCTTGPSCCRAV